MAVADAATPVVSMPLCVGIILLATADTEEHNLPQRNVQLSSTSHSGAALLGSVPRTHSSVKGAGLTSRQGQDVVLAAHRHSHDKCLEPLVWHIFAHSHGSTNILLSLLSPCSFELVHYESSGGVQDESCTHNSKSPGGNTRPKRPNPTTLLDNMVHGGDAAPVLGCFFWNHIRLHPGLDGIKGLCCCHRQESASDPCNDEGGLCWVPLQGRVAFEHL